MFTELFARQVERTPDRVAVRFGGNFLTYQELSERSARVARWLRAQGAEGLVALRLERSLDLLVGLLGIWRSGAAYLPLSAAFPAQRVELVLADARPSLVVEGLGEAEEGELPAPSELAYVMYTSGSTGRPKGVCVEHGSVASLLRCLAHSPGLGADDVLLAVTPVTFDMSIPELFLPLTVGATVLLASEAQARDGRELRALLPQATVLQATPATFRMLLEAGWERTPGLRIWCGGEHFGPELAASILERADELWNCYGPTETTVYASVARVEAGQPVLLGSGLGTHTSVSREEGEELVVRGPGVARGYLGGAQFAGVYRTGDRVRQVGKSYEFLGRLDDQLKLRGYRIEPGEVEAALASHPSVSACAVGVREERLNAWVVGRVGKAELQAHAREQLPRYMVPVVYHFMSALPLGVSGKIDRAALPSVEESVADVFRELVGSREGNFFALGGDSLLAAQAASLLAMRFQAELPAGVVFDRPTVGELAELLGGEQGVDVPAQGSDLTFAQERWLFLERLGQGQWLRRAWRVAGVDAARLEWCVAELVARHESLRTVLPSGDTVRVTHEGDRLELCVHHVAADRQSLRILLEELGALYAGRPLDLPGAPVSRFAAWERARLTPERLATLQAWWRSRVRPDRPVLCGAANVCQTVRLPVFPGVTPFVVVMAAFHVLLSKWTGETDLTIGFPVSLREREEFARTVGCLVNLLPLRVDSSGDPTFGELLEQVGTRVREALAHQDLPFEKLVECVAPARDGNHPLFTVLLAMEPADGALTLEGAEVEALPGPAGSHVEFTLSVEEDGRCVAEGAPECLMEAWPELLARLTTSVRLSALPGGRGEVAARPAARSAGTGPAEGLIAAVWERQLHREVGSEDNFFDLGGHSLLALRVVVELEKALGVSIPLSVLFEAQTPRALAAALEDRERLSACLVSLSPGVGTPLFCVHPNRGTVQIYRRLADRLERPVWAFEMIREPDGRLRHDSVAAMAEHYVDTLLRRHPDGPHHLCGVSLGGRIAYEMALLLRSRGLAAGVTVLLDTWGPGYPRALSPASLGRLSARERLSYVTRRLHNLRDRVEEGWMRAVSRFPVSLPRDWERVGARPFLEGVPLRPFPGRLHLFRAEEQPFGCLPEPTLGWGPYAEELVIVEVPGYHERMLHEPHVATVARKLEELLCSA